jgi:signal transduction histidine kinase
LPLAPRQLGTALLISFGLTVASFIASTLFLRSRAHGISTAAEEIALDAAPTLLHLSTLRTELRRMELALDDYTDRIVVHGSENGGPQEIQQARQLLDREWQLYTQLPASADERELWPPTTSAWAAMNDRLDRTLTRLREGDGPGAEHILNQDVKPAAAVLDDKVNAIERLDADRAAQLGNRILAIRQSVRDLSNVLDVLCALFAAMAALAAVRLVDRYVQVTEQRLSELDYFAGRVAHDIRSPLAAVGLALELAERSKQIDVRTQGILARGTRTLQRVGQLIDGLLLFARAGARPPHGAVANVKEVLDGVIEELVPSAREKSIELAVEPPEPSLTVASSPGVLASLFSNLLENAIKYMGSAPIRRIAVRAAAGNRGKVHLEVRDTGPGIPRELQAKVFEPYVRGAPSTTPGLGLGLATVRRLAEGHGGSVGVAPAEGGGSLFWIDLPRAPAA